MLKNVKEISENAIKDYLQSGFGEKFEITVSWGYPITSVKIKSKQNEEKVVSEFTVVYNLENSDYQLGVQTYKIIGEGEELRKESRVGTIDNNTLDFIVKGIENILNQIFTTPDEKPEAVAYKSEEEKEEK